MLNYGFVRVAGAIPFGKVCDVEYNKTQIISLIKEASNKKSSIIVFPELSLTSYTCQDLFQNTALLTQAINALVDIAEKTKSYNILSIIGLPIINENNLYNCAAVINNGKILGVIPKSYLCGYDEFYEPRWFADPTKNPSGHVFINNDKVPFGDNLLFRDKNINELIVGVEICHDLWMPISVSSYQALSGAVILCNLSASNVLAGKSDYRRMLVESQSSKCYAGYIYSSSGMGESTTDVVFDADAIIYENGTKLAESKRFLRENQIIYADIDIERLIMERINQNTFRNTNKAFNYIEFKGNTKNFNINRYFSMHPFVPEVKDKLDERCKEIFNIQAAGLAKRLESIPDINAVVGVSGGLDSTLALLVTIKAFNLLNKNLKGIIAVTMPGFGTTDRTYNNAVNLCKKFKITFKEISIKEISSVMFEKIGHDPSVHNSTYENIQARARTYILMTTANQYNGIVIGTGDLSEIALGWSTYNGDHMSMYNVNSSVPKTLVKFLVNWIANNEFDDETRKILLDILDAPISPELLPTDGITVTQKTEEKIGPYELHDFFLYYFIRFGFQFNKILYIACIAFKDKYKKIEIKKWLTVFYRRFFANQWKRDCVPAGPKVGSVDLSPRGTWRMPSEACVDSFLDIKE